MKDAFGFGSDIIHGHSTRDKGPSPTYVSWKSMIQRCLDPKKDNFPYYGGRGITVDPRWRSFENFLQDMGERLPGTMLGRIDNDGNYEPGNVVWEPASQHSKNRRNTVWVEHNGERLTLTEFAKKYCKVKRQALCNRRAQGWTIEEIKQKYLIK